MPLVGFDKQGAMGVVMTHCINMRGGNMRGLGLLGLVLTSTMLSTALSSMAWGQGPVPAAPIPCDGLTARTQVVSWQDRLVNGVLPPNGGLDQGQIVLTFDDGPHPQRLPIILDSLKECGVKAHFFFVGNRIRRTAAMPQGPALLARVVEEGHMVGSHSMNHSLSRRIGNLVTARNYGMLHTEVNEAHDLVMSTMGVWTPFIRFPYGHGWREPGAQQYIQRLGLVHLFWNMSNSDSVRGAPRGAGGVHDRALHEIRRYGRGILLAHERTPTASSLRALLIDLINEGYTFVTYAP